ncbi:MAG: cysteine--tRNA ligase [Verrucomicrobia bacterium]|nr:cysteine--tRNA ligase [Verrucomicrobiota bacterium]
MIRFLNSLSRALEPFQPLDPAGKVVKMYTCGPTVYSFAHIGNFRTYIFEDLLQRHLEARGYTVNRVMNITDVDDKTIRNSRAANIPLAEFTEKFATSFFEDMRALRIKDANVYPAATDPENIAEMIAMIDFLVREEIAYQAEDGSVYFRINRFPDYGHLAHLDLDELRPSGRIQSDEYEKESLGDFALWKAWDAADGPVGWDSPWGRGRPGWHIECSAMATRILGPQIDIHCGGVDNLFPHHEAEIAQSESCTGKKFVRYWLHSAHLLVEGQKMSKSLGNFYTIRDLIARGFTGREIRYALLRVNYRLQLNFTFDGMVEARQSLLRLDEWLQRLRDLAADRPPDKEYAPATSDSFFAALDDDLNISAALAEVFKQIRTTNQLMDANELQPAQAAALLDWWENVNQVLQIQSEEEVIPAAVEELLKQRAAARTAKDWQLSDALRKKISGLGWTVKDTKDGQKATKAAR